MALKSSFVVSEYEPEEVYYKIMEHINRLYIWIIQTVIQRSRWEKLSSLIIKTLSHTPAFFIFQ